jgi:5'-3' exonuclease
MDVYLIDGTYELFRHYYAVPSARDRDGREVGAVRGVLHSLLGMMTVGTTYIGVATDHVIESFRNDLWPGYKTGDGIEPELFAQFPLLEEMLSTLGVTVWPMVEFEADDALAAAAEAASADERVGRVFICTPDKDLAQSVRGRRGREIRRFARLDPGLSGARRRSRGRLSGTHGMGRPIDGRGAGHLRTHRGHSRRLDVLGRESLEAEGAGRDAGARP